MSRVAWISPVLFFLFVLAVPLFLVTASVTWAFNDPGVYHRGFQKYRIADTSGITGADLRQVGADLRHYFNSREEPLRVRTRVFGVEREVFNQREVLHMRDVKRLVWWVYGIAALSGLYLVAATAWGLASRRRAFLAPLAHRLLWGGGVTVTLVMAVGLFALAGFDTLFLRFHQLSFANDLWQLDPRRDYLLLMFPQGFWFDSTMRVAASAVAGAAALSSLSGGYLLLHRRLGKKGTGESFQKLEGAPEV